jgi:orotate phosphoribosyltransferase
MANKPLRHPDLASFIRSHAIRIGDFTLASGEKSRVYCDGKLATFDPVGINLVADALLEDIAGVDADGIGGLEMGAIPIVTAVALKGHLVGRDLKAFVVRKETKSHGTRKRIEGPIPDAPAKLIIVDDVVTKGGSILQAIDAARSAGYEVVLAISILDREQGGAELMAEAGVPYRSLLTMSEVLDGDHTDIAAGSARRGR